MSDTLTFTGTAAAAARVLVERTSLTYDVTVESTDETLIVRPPVYPLSGGQASLWKALESLNPFDAEWSLFNLAADVDAESWAAVVESLQVLRPVPAVVVDGDEVPC